MIKLMLVDDEVLTCEWLSYNIEKASPNYQIMGSYRNGQLAWEAIQKEQPDILITDIKMPVMDGMELVRLVKSAYPHIICLVLTSYADFEYARSLLRYEAVEYLLKTEIRREGLTETLDELLDRYQARVTRNESNFLVMELPSEKEEEVRAAAWIGLEETQPYIVLACSSPEILQRCCTEIGCASSRFLQKQSIFLQAVTWKPSGIQSLEKVGLLQPEISVGVSSIVFGTDQLYEGCRQAEAAYSLGIFKQLPTVVYEENQRVDTAALEKDYERLAFFFGMNQWEEAGSQLEMLLQGLEQVGCRNIELARVLCKKTELLFIEKLLFLNKKDKKKEELPADLASIRTYLSEQLKLCINEAQSSESGMVPEAIRYIKMHYARDLSLPEMAEHFGVTSEHFSRTFKKETGENFVKYLTTYRLNQAKRLLETTNLKITEVAELVGYRNLSYFSKQYKKHIGKTIRKPKENGEKNE